MPTAEGENEFDCVPQIVIVCVTDSECVNAKVNDKVSSLRSDCVNVLENENVFDCVNVFDNENVFDNVNVFDCVNVFDNVNVFDCVNVLENVFDSVNVNVGIAMQSSIAEPLLAAKFPNVSLWYDENVITDVETLEKAFSPIFGSDSP